MSTRFCILHDAECSDLAKWVHTNVIQSDGGKQAFPSIGRQSTSASAGASPMVWYVSLTQSSCSSSAATESSPANANTNTEGVPPGVQGDDVWLSTVHRILSDWEEEEGDRARGDAAGSLTSTPPSEIPHRVLLVVMILWDAFSPSSKRSYALAKAQLQGVHAARRTDSDRIKSPSIHVVIQLLNAKHGTANWPKNPDAVLKSFQKTVLTTHPGSQSQPLAAPSHHYDAAMNSASSPTSGNGSGDGTTVKAAAAAAEGSLSMPSSSAAAALEPRGGVEAHDADKAPTASAIEEALEAGGGECFFPVRSEEGPEGLEAKCRIVYQHCVELKVGCSLVSCASATSMTLPAGFLAWLPTPPAAATATATAMSAAISFASTASVASPCQATPQRMECELFLRRRHTGLDDIIELRLSMCGNVDSGKSTLTSVLTRGCRDDGRGFARSFVFRHRHEQDTGRTSSVSEHYVGFSATGESMNHVAVEEATSGEAAHASTGGATTSNPNHTNANNKKNSDSVGGGDGVESQNKKKNQHLADEVIRSYRPQELSQVSDKLVTLYDLAGHEKYLKTTVLGMTRGSPDYACVVISANNGIQRMTKEHLILCLALKIPFFIVVTRIDSTPSNVKAETMASIGKMLKSKVVQRKPFVLKSMADVVVAAKHLRHLALVPVIELSNVTGEGVPLLTHLLHLLPTRHRWSEEKKKPREMIIDNIFFVPGVGTVVAGIVTQGVFHANDTVLLGPDALGQFRPTTIKSIHIRGLNVTQVEAGNDAAFCLKKEKRSAIRKGNVLLEKSNATHNNSTGGNCSAAAMPKAYWQFDAEVTVLYHATTISVNYEPVIHSATVLQCARIIEVSNKDVLRTGDHASVRFHFVYRPEFLKVGQRIIFREGRTKGIGIVTSLTEASDLKKLKRSKTAMHREPPLDAADDQTN